MAICFSDSALMQRARRISLPVDSPWACRLRCRLCALSRPKTSLVACCLPHVINSSMRRGPSSSRIFTAAGLHRPSPALRVSCKWRMTSSSSLSAVTGGDCPASSFSSTSTRPPAASSIAARRPATPAPITTKSVSAGRPFIGGIQLRRGNSTTSRRAILRALTLLWNRMAQVTIHVSPRPYQAWIENGLLTRAGSVLSELLPQASRIFVVTVPPVRKRWGSKLVGSLKASGFTPQVIPMPDGEPTKRLSTVEALADKLVRLGADRKAVIIALGGGVVGDVGGLLASLYMRGIELVQVPTTVLAQVDASIGGKTAVNLVAGKNMLGAFYHPRVVLIDPAVLKTLPDREFRAGLS